MGKWFLLPNISLPEKAPVWSWPMTRRQWQRRSGQVNPCVIWFFLACCLPIDCKWFKWKTSSHLKHFFTAEHLEGHPQQRASHWGHHRLLQVRRRLHGCGQVRRISAGTAQKCFTSSCYPQVEQSFHFTDTIMSCILSCAEDGTLSF